MGIVREETREIDGITYTTRVFPASEALELAARLARMVDSQSWAAMLEVEVDELGGALSNPVLMLDGIISAAAKVEPAEFPALARALLKRTTADRVQIGASEVAGADLGKAFDEHFAGRLGHLFEVLVWVAQVGFAGPSSESP